MEPPEWLGEFGRDLQARRAACFFWATIFWTAAVGKDTGEQSVYISNQQVQRSNASLIYLMTAKPMPVQFVLYFRRGIYMMHDKIQKNVF